MLWIALYEIVDLLLIHFLFNAKLSWDFSTWGLRWEKSSNSLEDENPHIISSIENLQIVGEHSIPSMSETSWNVNMEEALEVARKQKQEQQEQCDDRRKPSYLLERTIEESKISEETPDGTLIHIAYFGSPCDRADDSGDQNNQPAEEAPNSEAREQEAESQKPRLALRHDPNSLQGGGAFLGRQRVRYFALFKYGESIWQESSVSSDLTDC